MEKKKVFFIPFAGGSSLSYSPCFNFFPEGIEPVGIELSGRGKRYREPLYQNLNKAVEDVEQMIEKEMNGEDYVIFGHSMGAVITFELYYKIKEKGLKQPKAIILSGRPAPLRERERINIREYSDEMFLKLASFYGGLPKEIETPEFRELFLPIMKSDFAIVDEYDFIEREEKIQTDMVVLCGKRDFSAPEKESARWEQFGAKRFTLYTFPEGHFFILEHFEEIAKIIVEQF